jgi:hypothetical protein
MAVTIAALFKQCNPFEDLAGEDPRFVDCSKERRSPLLLQTMENRIRFTEKSCQLFCGHRGGGKSTELKRLRERLEKTADGKPYFVVYCDIAEHLDVNDIDHLDVLLAIVQQLGKQASPGLAAKPSKMASFWSEIKDVLTRPVVLQEVEVDAEVLKFKFDLKDDADNRRLVREYLRPRGPNLLQAVNEVIARVKDATAEQYSGVVIIVDSLDRVLRFPGAAGPRPQEALFTEGAPFFAGLECHKIYTIPPAVMYSPAGLTLPPLFQSSQPSRLPMIPVTDRNSAASGEGLAVMRRIVEARVLAAGAKSLGEVFEEAAVERLISASGGFVRQLMVLLQTTCGYATGLPIPVAAVDDAIREGRDIFQLSIPEEQWKKLAKVRDTKRLPPTVDRTREDERTLQLLDTFAILEYLDADGPWYDVNPTALTAMPKASAASA